MSREIVIEVLGKKDADELWGAGYGPVLPVYANDFEMGGVLPAVIYMLRWGHRRGRGKFQAVYGKDASVMKIAHSLTGNSNWFSGFEGEVQQNILADLLLAFCLENKGHQVERDEKVQRIFPTHYFSSWVDLPTDSANLRGVPEMIVNILTSRSDGTGQYSFGDLERNPLLSLFGTGVSIAGDRYNLKSDRFDDNAPLGIDQILAVRLAQSLGEAPLKVRGENPEIPKQMSVALRAGEVFFHDFNDFIWHYGKSVPRQALLPMLESCLALGVTNILLSALGIMLHWAETGTIPDTDKQHPWPLFVDCSVSTEYNLRRFSEEGMDDLLRRLTQLPVVLMCLRILNQWARQEYLTCYPTPEPNPTYHLNFMGNLLFGRVDEARDLERDLRRKCNSLANALEKKGENEVLGILTDKDHHPAWRLAEALVLLMGDKVQGAQFRKFLRSSLMDGLPNGLSRKRRGVLKGKSVERRSMVLTNTVLDFLVHRHLLKSGIDIKAGLSLTEFIRLLRDEYGFYVDESPANISVPVEQLLKNRNYLERRLRDLGLLVGVNDAEAMKRLHGRFEVDHA